MDRMALKISIEIFIGRRWWLGKQIKEILDYYRADNYNKFIARKTLREYNIKRKAKGLSQKARWLKW